MKIFFACFVLLFLSSGCATDKEMTMVSGTAWGKILGVLPASKTFVIFRGPETSTNKTDKNFEEYRQALTQVLKKHGYTPASNNETPAIALYLSYSISNPIDVEYNKSISTIAPSEDLIASTSKNGIVTYSPEYQYGSTKIKEKITSYMISFWLVAADPNDPNLDPKTQRRYWAAAGDYFGQRESAQFILPYLMEGVGPWLGKDSKGIVPFDIPISDRNTSL